MSEHTHTNAHPEPDSADEVAADIEDAGPEEVDEVVDSGKLRTSHDDLDDAAGGPMQVP
jgi:hypothetical protein